jgi:hypothetical protein
MHSAIRLSLLVLLLISVSPAFAISYPCADNETSCGGEETVETDGSYSGGFKPPETATCTARGSKNQACRACVPQYADDGQPTGYIVCGYVVYSANCSCDIKGTSCAPKGSCTWTW